MQEKSRTQVHREKRRFWTAHIQAWQKSGYSLAAYGKQHNLVYHRLIYWKTKLANKRTKHISFVPVPLQPAPPDTPLILNLQNDRFTIKIGTDFSAKLLNRLITALESL